jgi:glutamine synthetase
MAKTPQEVLRQIKDEGIELIDLKFTDLHGKWQHLTVCTDLLEEESFTEGLAFDGSSIRGWKAINASDMAMVPDPSSAWIDPFYRHKTLSMICSIQDPRTWSGLRPLSSGTGATRSQPSQQHRTCRHGVFRTRA